MQQLARVHFCRAPPEPVATRHTSADALPWHSPTSIFGGDTGALVLINAWLIAEVGSTSRAAK